MFSGIKLEELMESEHSGIFRVELVTKNVVFGSSGTHFMHMKLKDFLLIWSHLLKKSLMETSFFVQCDALYLGGI